MVHSKGFLYNFYFNAFVTLYSQSMQICDVVGRKRKGRRCFTVMHLPLTGCDMIPERLRICETYIPGYECGIPNPLIQGLCESLVRLILSRTSGIYSSTVLKVVRQIKMHKLYNNASWGNGNHCVDASCKRNMMVPRHITNLILIKCA